MKKIDPKTIKPCDIIVGDLLCTDCGMVVKTLTRPLLKGVFWYVVGEHVRGSYCGTIVSDLELGKHDKVNIVITKILRTNRIRPRKIIKKHVL